MHQALYRNTPLILGGFLLAIAVLIGGVAAAATLSADGDQLMQGVFLALGLFAFVFVLCMLMAFRRHRWTIEPAAVLVEERPLVPFLGARRSVRVPFADIIGLSRVQNVREEMLALTTRAGARFVLSPGSLPGDGEIRQPDQAGLEDFADQLRANLAAAGHPPPAVTDGLGFWNGPGGFALLGIVFALSLGLACVTIWAILDGASLGARSGYAAGLVIALPFGIGWLIRKAWQRRTAVLRTMRALLLPLLLATPAAAQELKIATWNIAWLTTKPRGHPDLPRNLAPRTDADFQRLRAYATQLDADIVAMQEVDGQLAAARVFDATRYAFHFSGGMGVQNVGFAIRKTLRWRANDDLVALALRERLRRGADITVETPAGPLRLLTVHLKEGCNRDPLGSNRLACGDMDQQAGILADWIAARARANDSFIVLGDFNRRLNADEGMLARLQAAAPLTLVNQGFRNPCWGFDSPFIDNILLGGAARNWLVTNSLRVMVFRENDRRLQDALSDHCPVSLRVRAAG